MRCRLSTDAVVSLQFSVVSGELGSGRQVSAARASSKFLVVSKERVRRSAVVAVVDVAAGTVMGSELAGAGDFVLVVGMLWLVSGIAG